MAITSNKWILLKNNGALRGKDQAGTGVVEILKVNTSDEVDLLSTTNYTDATHGAGEIANKAYIAAVVEGRKAKEAARLASTENVALSGGATLTIDGVSVANGDRILLKDQTSSEENGIYVASGIGSTYALTRSDDFNAVSPIDEVNNAYVAVQAGTENAAKVFVQTATVATIDTDPITFVFYNAVSNLIGGDGIDITGSTVSVDLASNPGLEFDSGSPNKIRAKVNTGTMALDANGIGVKDAGIDTTQLAADAVTGAKIRLDNAEALRARNNADDGDVNILSVDASDNIVFASTPYDADATAPTNDAELANKKYVDDQIALVDKTTLAQEQITLDGTDITNQYVDLAGVAESAASISLTPVDGPEQQQTVDYTVSLTGGAGGVTRITFAGDLATGGDAALVAGDVLMIHYAT